MDKRDLDDKRVMHIDTSGKLHQRKVSGIAYKIVESGLHKGVSLSIKLKRELKRRLKAHKDFARIYAICIYYLIKDNLGLFDVLVVCGDEKFTSVKRYLDLLFEGSSEYSKKEVISLYELRRISGNRDLRSFADGIAGSYRKRGLKSRGRRQKSISLDVVEIDYEKIRSKWLRLGKIKDK